MYRPGLHRTQMDRYKRESTADRTLTAAGLQ
jgi:hypothetical protein